jgi:hypothetical protein
MVSLNLWVLFRGSKNDGVQAELSNNKSKACFAPLVYSG